VQNIEYVAKYCKTLCKIRIYLTNNNATINKFKNLLHKNEDNSKTSSVFYLSLSLFLSRIALYKLYKNFWCYKYV